MEKENIEVEEEKKIISALSFENYNKSGQPGIDLVVNIVDTHKNWGLLRCVALTNIY